MQHMPKRAAAQQAVGWYQGPTALPQSTLWGLLLPESARGIYYKEGLNVRKEPAQEHMFWCLQVSAATSQSHLLARNASDYPGDLGESVSLGEC